MPCEVLSEKDNMNIIFLVFTPAQLMNAIILAKEAFSYESCDLLYDEKSMGSFSTVIANSGVFQNAYMRRPDPSFPHDTPVHALRAVREYASAFQGMVDFFPFDPLHYDRAFISGVNLWNFQHYYAMKEKNPNLSLSVYEEGICEYYTLGLPVNIPRFAFSRIFCHHYYLSECDSLYAHCPDVVRNRWRNIKVKRIPPVSDSVRDILNYVFTYRPTQLEMDEGQAIFLEQRYFNENLEQRQREWISRFAESLPPGRFKIKLHPASAPNKYDESYPVLRVTSPMEIIAMNEDISSSVFFTINSSAAVNLRLMSRWRSNIAMLYRLDSENVPPYLDDLFRRVQNQPSDGNFWIPKNEEELSEILKFITDSIGTS